MERILLMCGLIIGVTLVVGGLIGATIEEKEINKCVPDSIEPVMPKIKYVNRDVKCEHTNKEGVEIWGGYDGISMWVCKDCGMGFDRWSDLPIVVQYSTLEQYTQPMFLLSDGSMSRFSERWRNPLHKGRTLNRVKYQDFRF